MRLRFPYLCIALLLCLNARAATPRLLSFDVPTVDIGVVRADGGVIKTEFRFTSIAVDPVVIVDVHAQCGCTVAGWPKTPIKAGSEGVIEVTLDPKDLFGEFTKSLTVVSNNGKYRKFSTISVTGKVIGELSEQQVAYPYLLAEGLRSTLQTVGMRQIARGTSSVKRFTLCNTSARTMLLWWSADSRAVSVDSPKSLAAGATSEVEVTVSTISIPEGEFTQTLRLYVDGNPVAIPVYLKGMVK